MYRRIVLCLVIAVLVPVFAPSQESTPAPLWNCHPFASRADAENYLRTARVVAAKGTGIGITLPRKLTLDDGKLRHPALFKSIDERKPGLTQLQHGPEFDFKDSWRFEVAAYELDKLLSLDMVPVTVERLYNGQRGSLQFWVENCIMEGDRIKKKLQPPDPLAWNRQIWKVRIFDNLIHNIDRNLGNLLISTEWRCYMVDHSRSFKAVDFLKSPKDLTHFSRTLMASLSTLEAAAVQKACGKYLTGAEISSMLRRRDRILKVHEQRLAEQGSGIDYP
jgi:hypothetical protein